MEYYLAIVFWNTKNKLPFLRIFNLPGVPNLREVNRSLLFFYFRFPGTLRNFAALMRKGLFNRIEGFARFAGEITAHCSDCSIYMQKMHKFNKTACKPFRTISLLNHINQAIWGIMGSICDSSTLFAIILLIVTGNSILAHANKLINQTKI